MSHFEETIRTGNYVILDTETTSRYPKSAEIVCIGIIDPAGHTVLHRLVKPRMAIPPETTAIHGITDEQVKDAATFRQLFPAIVKAIQGRDVIAYNADYDLPVLIHCCDLSGIPVTELMVYQSFQCAMKWYAPIRGDWNPDRHDYRWQKLTDAIAQQNLPIKSAHGALGDCRMTLALINKLIPLPKAPAPPEPPAADAVSPAPDIDWAKSWNAPVAPPTQLPIGWTETETIHHRETPGEWLDRQPPPDEL